MFEEVGIRAVVQGYGTYMSQTANINKSTEGLKTGLGGLQKVALIGGAALAGVGAAAMMLAKSSISAAAQMETYVTQFKVLLGSADAAKARLAELAKFAAITPFELPEVVQASKLLQTFGGTALATGKTLTMVGDMAAASGAGYGEIATWVGRAYTAIQSGRPFGEAGMRLQELALMSGETRSNLEELQKTGASSTVIWEAFTASMGKYEGMMGELSVTFTGLTSTVADSYKGLLRDFGTPLLEPAKVALKMIIDFLSAPAVLAGAKALGEAIAGLATQFLNLFSDKMTGAGEAFGGVLQSLAANLKEMDFSKLVQGGGEFFKTLMTLFETLTLLGGPLVLIGRTILPELAGVLTRIAMVVLPVLNVILEQTANLLEAHPELVWAIIIAWAAFKVGAIVQGLVSVTVSLVAMGAAAWTAAAGVIAATWPFIAIGAAIAAVTAIIILAIRHWDDITAAVERARNWFMNLPAPIKIVAVTLNLPLVALIALGVGINKLVTNWDTSWLAIRKATETVVNAVISGFNFLLRGVEFVINTIIDAYNTLPGWMRGDKIKHITLQIDPIDLTPIYKAITAYDALAFVMKRVGARAIEAADDTALLMNRAKNATSAVKSFADSAAAAGDSITAVGDGAGGAAEAFRGLDQDLVDLRQTMMSVAESGLAAIAQGIQEEEAYLADVAAALAIAEEEHARLGVALQDVNKDISAATEEMNKWKNAILEGTRAFSDASQAIDESSNKLALAIAKVKLGVLEEGLEKGDYASAKLSAQIKTLARLIGVDLHGAGKLTFEKIQEVLEAAGGQMDIFSQKASVVNLQEKVKLGPEQYKLEKFFQDLGGYAEFSYEEIIAGASDAAREMAVLIIKQNDLNLSIERQAGLVDFLNKVQKDHEEILGRLQKAYDDLFGLTSKIDPSIKAIWEAQGGDQVIKSIEDAFAAMDRGQTDAATTAMNNATTLFDSIKAAIAVIYPGKENLLAPIETLLGEVETKVEIDVGDVGKLLSGDLSGISDDLGAVDKSVTGVQGEVTRGFMNTMNNLRDWVVTLLYGIAANTNYLGELLDIRLSTEDAVSELIIHTDLLSQIRDAIGAIDLTVEVPAAQKGAYVRSAGLASLHAGEIVWPNLNSMIEELMRRTALAGGGVAPAYPVSPHYVPSHGGGGNGGGVTIVSSPTFTTPTNEMMRQYERSFRSLAFSLRRP